MEPKDPFASMKCVFAFYVVWYNENYMSTKTKPNKRQNIFSAF